MLSTSTFEAFWAHYPRKVGKLAAERAWRRQHPPLSDVLEALAWQMTSDQWKRGFIPHPTTYLNQGRWLDEPPVTPQMKFDRVREAPCAICGYPEPAHHSAVQCNELWLAQQKREAQG